jgi:hypothetical protein
VDQTIAALSHGLQDGMSIVVNRAPDFVNALHQAIVRDRGTWPHSLHKLVLGDQAIGPFTQVAKHRKALRAQHYCVPGLVLQRFIAEVGKKTIDRKAGTRALLQAASLSAQRQY